jgi:sialidase-1
MFVRPMILLAFALSPLPAAEPTRIDLWEAGKGGYAIYRIPGIAATPKGTLVAYCEARKSHSDWGSIDLQVRRSTDGGATWSEPRRIGEVAGPHAQNPLVKKARKPDEITFNNPVMIADRKTGAVHFLFCIEYMRCYHSRSDDDGATFSQPVEITKAFDAFRTDYDWKVLATGPGHGIQLKSGRLLVPVWLSRGTGGNAHHPSMVSTIVSDDGGKSWQRGEIAANETDPLKDPNETCAAELADGRVMLNIRHEAKERRRAVTFSKDGTTGWTTPAFDEALREPVCFASLCRWGEATKDGPNRLLFVNPDTPTGRKNLTVRLSDDEGKSWKFSKVLDPGASAYSDLAVDGKGTIFCLYERGGYKALTLAKFDLAWLTDGKDTGTPK